MIIDTKEVLHVRKILYSIENVTNVRVVLNAAML